MRLRARHTKLRDKTHVIMSCSRESLGRAAGPWPDSLISSEESQRGLCNKRIISNNVFTGSGIELTGETKETHRKSISIHNMLESLKPRLFSVE